MKVSSLLAAASFVFLPLSRAADATTPVEYTQRNGAFAPAASIPIEKKTLPNADAVQGKRPTMPVVERIDAPVGERRAAIEVTEAQPKNVRPAEVHPAQATAQPLNAYNHRPAAITTAADTTKPPMVAKYQDTLTAANATKVERLSAGSRDTTAKINRFVFRKNPPDAFSLPEGAPATPAAGGSPIKK